MESVIELNRFDHARKEGREQDDSQRSDADDIHLLKKFADTMGALEIERNQARLKNQKRSKGVETPIKRHEGTPQHCKKRFKPSSNHTYLSDF